MYTVIICCPVCTVINFEINLSCLIKSFIYITKKSGQKCKYLKNEKEKKKNKILKTLHFKGAFIEANKNNFFGR